MKKILFLFTLLLLSSCSKQEKSVATKDFIFDDKGNKVEINGVPNKVISLAPSVTEMIYALNAEGYLVGNTLYCDYPKEAQTITKVGDMLKIDYEKIIELNPDLIFVSIEGNSKETYDRLKGLGFNIFITNPRDFSGIKKSMRDLAKIFKKTDIANELIPKWVSEVDSIKLNAQKFNGLSGMFLISANPLMVAGSNTFINKYLELCNVANIADGLPQNYPILSREEVLSKNPEYIFLSADHGMSLEDVKKLYPEWKNIEAVKKGKIIVIDPNLFFRPGPRFSLALKTLFTEIDKLESN